MKLKTNKMQKINKFGKSIVSFDLAVDLKKKRSEGWCE